MISSSTPQNLVVPNLGVPARGKVTGKTARQNEFITFGCNLAGNIVITLSIGPAEAIQLMKKLFFAGKNAADAIGLELRFGCILHRA